MTWMLPWSSPEAILHCISLQIHLVGRITAVIATSISHWQLHIKSSPIPVPDSEGPLSEFDPLQDHDAHSVDFPPLLPGATSFSSAAIQLPLNQSAHEDVYNIDMMAIEDMIKRQLGVGMKYLFHCCNTASY